MEYVNELQDVLKSMFLSERKYFVASQKVQNPELLRFLNHQNILRNGYINKLVEVFEQKQIGLSVFEVEKRKHVFDIDDLYAGLHIKKQGYLELMEECLDHDQKLIQKCINCLNIKNIPLDILEVLTKISTSLIFYGIDGNKVAQIFKRKCYHQNYNRSRSSSLI